MTISTPPLSSASSSARAAAPPNPQPTIGKVDQMSLSCDYCRIPKQNKPLLCSRCKQIHYCSIECQKAAFKAHKTFCLKIAAVKPPLPGPEVQVCQWMEEDGTIVPLTQRQFFEKTGAYYTDHYLTNGIINQLPPASSERSTHPFSSTSEAVKAFEKKPPSLVLCKEPPMGFGLRAGENIKEGSIISLYAGLVNPLLEQMSSIQPMLYSLAAVDATDFRGSAAFINDGVPNCFANRISHYQGFAEAPIIVASRDIAEGEFLHFCYGSGHPVKGAMYHIDAKARVELEEFCASQQFYNPRSQHGLVLRSYISCTPNVLFVLLLGGHLDVGKTRNLFKISQGDWKKIGGSPTVDSMKTFTIGLTLDGAESLLAKSKKLDPSFIQKVINTFSEGISVQSLWTVLQVHLNGNEFLNEHIENYHTSGQLWDTLRFFIFGNYSSPFKEKVPYTPLNIEKMTLQFSSLPLFLKNMLIREVGDYIDHCKKEGWVKEEVALLELLQAFKKVK